MGYRDRCMGWRDVGMEHRDTETWGWNMEHGDVKMRCRDMGRQACGDEMQRYGDTGMGYRNAEMWGWDMGTWGHGDGM